MNSTIRTDTPHDSPQVLAPPPLIYITGLAVGIILHLLRPVPFLPKNLAWPIGIALIAISVVLVVAAMRALMGAGTHISVLKPAIRLVATGPYRFTRNPIYLSMTLLALGIAAWINALWMIALLVPVLFLIHFRVVKREETYLAKKFGEDYLRYRSKVRRWV